MQIRKLCVPIHSKCSYSIADNSNKLQVEVPQTGVDSVTIKLYKLTTS